MKKLSRLKTNGLLALLMVLFLNYPLLHAKPHDPNSYMRFTWGMVTQDGINIRQYPDTYSNILGRVNYHDILIITGKCGKWYQIRHRNENAWIYSMYIEGYKLELLPETISPTSEDLLRREIVSYAKQFIGTPYRYGGQSLRDGVDCSGFTQAIMDNFDISLHRNSHNQIKDGKSIKKGDLSPADLIFFDTSGKNSGKISHVGLYIGNNRFIHATTSKGVKIDNLSQAYYQKCYVKAVSVVNH